MSVHTSTTQTAPKGDMQPKVTEFDGYGGTMADRDHTPGEVSTPERCLPAYGAMVLSGLLGTTSLALFGVFLFAGLPAQVHFGLAERPGLLVNTLLCGLFFLQHSLMLRKGFRQRLRAYLPATYHGALFSICSAVFLLLLMLCWQKPAPRAVELEGAGFWIMRAFFLLSMVGFYVSGRSLRRFDPFGTREISMHMRGARPRGSRFIVRGPYRWVRHPLYFFFLMMIWTPVSISADRWLFNLLWTAWIVVGTRLEERDLVAAFGDAYRRYQREVPMLIPYKGFPRGQ